jgi:phosphoribosylaminoimidazole-succinocarboxamide synthase
MRPEDISLVETNYQFEGQKNKYSGKVRDVYEVNNYLIMIVSDRISAFDHVMPRPIPYKGQVLNQLAKYFLYATNDIVPNWYFHSPDPNVTIGKACEPIPVEMVIRGYLTGHAWREYKAGKRVICGEEMPDGMAEHDAFKIPIITPTLKAQTGHDEDISRADLIRQGILSTDDWLLMERFTRLLFKRGQEMARERGLILVDTKYEFGRVGKNIILIDEIHTPDSSRYFYLDGYEERQKNGEPQQQLSKEFVREWLMDNGFQGLDGQQIPEMTDEFIQEVSDKYIQLYEHITGLEFERNDNSNIQERVRINIEKYLEKPI